MKVFVGSLVAYVMIFIYTFGHAYAHYPDTEKGYFGGVEYTIHNGSGTKGSSAFISSIFWPLYWSIKFQESDRNGRT